MAKESVARVSPDSNVEIIQEGSEPNEFWNALGGKGDYDKELDKPGLPFLESRLFHCKVLDSGKFVVKEIFNFYQEDLDVDDVFIMDGGDEIYVWEGKFCSDSEKEKSMQLASVCVVLFCYFLSMYLKVCFFFRLIFKPIHQRVSQNPCQLLPFSKVMSLEALSNCFPNGKTIFGNK